MKFRKKPVVIEAMLFTYPATDSFREFLGAALGYTSKDRHPNAKGEAQIFTLEDGKVLKVNHIATEGDWIIKGVQGEFYPCKPDIFQATYEAVSQYLARGTIL